MLNSRYSRERRKATSYPERYRTKVLCGNLSEALSNLRSKAFMKNRKNYIARSTATLTQSGLLAALLQHQRRKVIELSQRRAQREQARGLLRNSLTWLLARSHRITPVDDSVGLRTGNPPPAHLNLPPSQWPWPTKSTLTQHCCNRFTMICGSNIPIGSSQMESLRCVILTRRA